MQMSRFASATDSWDIAMGMCIVVELVRVAGIDANIVVSEFAHLCIVDTENFRFLIGAQAETGDVMHNPEDDGLCKLKKGWNDELIVDEENWEFGGDNRRG